MLRNFIWRDPLMLKQFQKRVALMVGLTLVIFTGCSARVDAEADLMPREVARRIIAEEVSPRWAARPWLEGVTCFFRSVPIEFHEVGAVVYDSWLRRTTITGIISGCVGGGTYEITGTTPEQARRVATALRSLGARIE
ncbi:MAG: hypothetical protein JWM42_757 [Burkholderia sp.]|nr:hypothetical protein [Burkholderia sp.]